MESGGRSSGFAAVLRVGEFRALWLAELLSVLGDQLARVALAVLVYDRTSSAVLSALTYALTFVPAVLGGAMLAGLADRYPRRRVLVLTDIVRAALAATMAVPGLPLPLLWVLVALLSMAAGPFKAAQLALLPLVVRADQYVSAMSLRQVTAQTAQLAGFATGGLLLTAVPPGVALGTNAATFLIGAGLVLAGVRHRRAAALAGTAATTGRDRLAPGVLPIFALVALTGLFVVPEGVAAPYGAAAGPAAVGLLMAADPLGSVIGAWLLARSRIRPTPAGAVLLAALAGVPLLACAPGPGLTLSLVLWAASGALSTAYLIQAQALLVELVPDHRRGRIMGRLATCLYASQGLAIVAGGAVTEVAGPFRAVAAAGLLGVLLTCAIGLWWRGRRPVEASESDRAAPGMAEVRPAQMSLFRMAGTSSQGDTGGSEPPVSRPIDRPGRPSPTSTDGC